MHPLLPLLVADIAQLHKFGIHSPEQAKLVLEDAVKKNRAKSLYPELAQKAGLCQKVIVNIPTFKVMMRWYLNSLKIGPKSHSSSGFVAGEKIKSHK